MAERILYQNGKIYTADPQDRIVECMVTEEKRILYAGAKEEGEARYGAGAETVDLAGAVILPAFIDAHAHLRLYADSYFGVSLSGLNNLEKYKQVLRGYLDENPHTPLIKGFGWLESLIPVTGPSKKVLDEVSQAIPIVLTADSGHSLWVNSAALAAAGISRETKDPENGLIQREENGEAAGVLREAAQDLILDKLADYSVPQYKAAFKSYEGLMHSLGIAGILDAWHYRMGKENPLLAAAQMAKQGELAMYVRGAYHADPACPQDQIEHFKARRERDCAGELFRMDTVKFFEDGVFEGRSGYLLDPYNDNGSDDPDYAGAPVWRPEQLKEKVREAMEAGFQVHIHALADGAVKEALDAVAYAVQQCGYKGNRNVLTHMLLMDEKDFKRFSDLEILAVLNPYWIEIDDLYYANLQILGEERTRRLYPIQSFLDAGVRCAMGSDFPVTDIPSPFIGIELGMTRTSSVYYHPWASEWETDAAKYRFQYGSSREKAQLLPLLRMATIEAAYSLFLEKFTGSIEAGKYADFILIDQDIFAVPAEEISNTNVLETYFQGRRVYRRI